MRDIADSVTSALAEKRIDFIAGPHQVGNTTFAKSLLRDSGEAYFNRDLDTHRRHIVLDEIQKFPRWNRLLKGVFDTRASANDALERRLSGIDLTLMIAEPRNNLVRCVSACVGLGWIGMAIAQPQVPSYPARPIRLIVPFAPGGVGDTLLRPIAAKLTERWGQQIVFDHRAGANTIIGTELAAKANPDGYTLLFVSATSMSINPHVYQRLPYNAARDFVPVAPITAYSYVVAAHPSLAANTPSELIALAKAKPGTISYASTGNGSSGHLAGAMFELLAGVKLLHVPFKGSAPATLELLAGRVLLNFGGMALVSPQVKAGKLKVIGVCSEKRLALWPDIPAFGEVGLKNYEGGTWFGIVAPAGTPRAIVDALNGAVTAAVLSPDVKERQVSLGLDVYTDTPQGFDKFIQTDRARIGAVVKAFNIRVD